LGKGDSFLEGGRAQVEEAGERASRQD
jgi:hypothetical protein